MLSLFISNIEYVTLRLLRRFVFPKDLHRWGRYVPFYQTNVGESQPDQVCRPYIDWLAAERRSVVGRRVIEVGSGATNAVGYALICAGATQVWCVEPFVAFDQSEDAVLLDQLAKSHGLERVKIAAAVTRCESFAPIESGSADLIVSHSVLEHVSDLASLFSDMHRAMATSGAMLHVVDYRDHFFKYPLHFLQFSKKTWRKFLDPGDLPRWRLGDHTLALEQAGFALRVLRAEENAREFARIKPNISADFNLSDPSISVLRAVIYGERKKSTHSASR